MEGKHPIENIMRTTMENIRDMVDVDTVIGEPILTQDGSTVIPVSRVSFGFVAGGAEYHCGSRCRAPAEDGDRLPFGGGTGAGVTLQPMGFLVTNQNSVRLLPAQAYAPADRIIELVPQLMCEVKTMLKNKNEKDQAKKAGVIPPQPNPQPSPQPTPQA